MVEVKIGNIFESKCDTLVNTVNCVGVMGKGIALDFKRRYPDMFYEYVKRCNAGHVNPGRPYLYNNGDGVSILNFPTKVHWRSPSKLQYIVDGLDWFVLNYQKLEITSIAFPPLGCGNGGLSWSIVGPVMFDKLNSLPIHIEIYAPFGTSQSELSYEFLMNNNCIGDVIGNDTLQVNPKWYLILYVVKSLDEKKYSIKVGRTIYQKICYVLTRLGIDTGFTFTRASYGPFSPQVKDSLTALANANLITERQLGRMMELRVNSGISFDRFNFTDEEKKCADITVDLFGRIKSTEYAEIVATILYSYDQINRSTKCPMDTEVLAYILSWKPHWADNDQRRLVLEAIHNLAMLSWIDVAVNSEV